MNKFDALIIRLVSIPAHAFERWTGINNFWQAYYVFQIAAFMAVVREVIEKITGWKTETAMGVAFAAFIVMIWLLIMALAGHASKKMAIAADRNPDKLPTMGGPVINPANRMINMFLGLPLDALGFTAKLETYHGYAKIFAVFAFALVVYSIGLYLCAIPRPPAQTKREAFTWLKPVPTHG